MTPELHRPVVVERVGAAGLDYLVEATPEECVALAHRMQLPAVLSLTCRFHLQRDLGKALMARGHLTARVIQTCIISLDDFTATVEERFEVRCIPAGAESDDLDPDAPDEIACDDGIVNLGEAAAEQLALALDPYPRAPGAELPDIEVEPEPRGFAGLEALRRRH
jgi:hypothetical protein